MWTEEKLNELLTTPSQALIEDMKKIEGDILVLGAGGKMGYTLCVLAKNAIKAAGIEKRVIAVSRFSDEYAVNYLKRQDKNLKLESGNLLVHQEHSHQVLEFDFE